jgi:NAD(P)-dependent dehydrogenase (short-subunit alcohol dehydrogenase family)
LGAYYLDMQLKGRTAFVTGANRGIGLEVCKQLGEEGAKIIMGVRDPSRAKNQLEDLIKANIDATVLQIDVSDSDSIHELTSSKLERVDILINNAAVLDRARNIFSLEDDEFEKIIRTNVIGAALLAKHFGAQMKKRGWGRIVNVSSGMGSISREFGGDSPAYRISKVALNALTITLAEALSGSGVLVNSVDPGWVRTEMGGKSATRSVQQGAYSIVWAALLPDNGPTAGFFYDGKPVPW